MRERRSSPDHAASERRVEREAQPVADDRLVQRSMAFGQGQRGRVALAPGRRSSSSKKGPPTLTVVDVAVMRPRLRARACAARPPDGFVEHLPIEGDGAGAALALGLRERRDHVAGPLHLLVGRRKGIGQRRELRGVDRPLAVEAELTGPRDCSGEGGIDRHAEIGPVDRLQPVCAGRQQQHLLGGTPTIEISRGRAGAAERDGEVGVAEDQRVEPRRRARDLLHARQAGRRLDQRLHPQGARATGRCFGAVEQALDERQVAGALDLRHDNAGRLRPEPRRGRRCRDGTTACAARSLARSPSRPPKPRSPARRRRLRARSPSCSPRPRPRGR